jgi:hypothetical protein
MITPEDSLLVTTSNQSLTSGTPSTSSLLVDYGDANLTASYQYNNVIASSLDTSKIIVHLNDIINATFTVTDIRTYIDLASPSVYFKLINAAYSDTWDLSLIDSFEFNVNKVINETLKCFERYFTTLTTACVDAYLFQDILTPKLTNVLLDSLEIIETISFAFDTDRYEIVPLYDQLRSSLLLTRNEQLILNLSDEINNLNLNKVKSDFIFINDDIRFDFNKDMFEVVSLYEMLRPTLNTVIRDIYSFSPADFLNNIVLVARPIDALQIEESISYMFNKNQYEVVSFNEIVGGALGRSIGDSYTFLDSIYKVAIAKDLDDYVGYIDVTGGKISRSYYETVTFNEFIPTYVQRTYESFPIEEYLGEENIDAIREMFLGVQDSLRTLLKRGLSDTLNATEHVLLTLRPKKYDTVAYGVTISGFVDNYFEPGYCDLGYAGIPI